MKSKLRIIAMAFGLATFAFAKDVVSDGTIHDLVSIKLTEDAVVKGGALQVEVEHGVVTLRGAVELEKQKDRAAKLAKRVKGVKQVINNITLRNKNTPQ